MQQILQGGTDNDTHITTTEYNLFTSGGQPWNSTEANIFQVISAPGDLSNLRIKLENAPGTSNDSIFVVRLNGSDSGLTVTISGAVATSGFDIVNTVAVVAGDKISIEHTPVGGPTVGWAFWSMLFTSTNAKESQVILGSGAVATQNDSDSYISCSGGTLSNLGTQANRQQMVSAAGELDNLYVELVSDPGTAPDAYTITLQLNGIDTALKVTITANDTIGNDVTNKVSVVPGDLINYIVEPISTPLTQMSFGCGMTFLADVDGESLVLGGTSDAPSAAAAEYFWLGGSSADSWSAAEAQRYYVGQTFILRSMYVKVTTAPGVGNSYAIRSRIGGVNGNLLVTVSGTDTTGNDIANSDTIEDDNDVNVSCTPASTPDASTIKFGMVMFIGPVASSTARGHGIGIGGGIGRWRH